MLEYQNLATKILAHGSQREDRTGTGTRSLFGPQLEFDLREGFPAVTTKKLRFSSVVRELQWMLSGSTNVRDLHPVKIWDEWADENGDLGPVYGAQWRKWWDYRKLQPIDQIHEVIKSITDDPAGRRHIVSAWNVSQLKQMKLPPCHLLFQFYVDFHQGRPFYLDCKMYQRSADYFLGVPFNIAQYALLTHIIAELTQLMPRNLIISFGDVHCYNNHVTQLEEQISRNPFRKPRLVLPTLNTLDEYIACRDIALDGYKSHPALRGEISV